MSKARHKRAFDREDRRVVGPAMFCYKKDQWDLFKQSAQDSDVFEETWEEWYASLQKLIRRLREEGMNPVLLEVDYYTFMNYCGREGLPNNGETRSEYAASMLQRTRQVKKEGNGPGC